MRTSWSGVIAAGGAGGPVELFNVSNPLAERSEPGSGVNSVSAGGVNFGSQGGPLLVAIGWTTLVQARTVTHITAGGPNLTRILRASGGAVTGSAEIWATEENVASSGNLTMSINSNANDIGFKAAVFRAPRLRGITPHDTAVRNDAVTGTVNSTVSVPAGGITLLALMRVGTTTETIVGTDLTIRGPNDLFNQGGLRTWRAFGEDADTGGTANFNLDSNGASNKRLVMASFR